jgi:hypothetical protein
MRGCRSTVAIIAMGNLIAYELGRSRGRPTLARTVAWPRTPQPSAALVDARAIVRLIDRWDGSGAAIASDNLSWTNADARRRSRRSGRGRADGAFDVENAPRNSWKMNCDCGSLRVAIARRRCAVQSWQGGGAGTAGVDRRGGTRIAGLIGPDRARDDRFSATPGRRPATARG